MLSNALVVFLYVLLPMTVLALSQRLRAFPELRAAFWARVLSQTEQTKNWRIEAESWLWMTADPRFPEIRLVVFFPEQRRRGGGYSNTVDLDAIVQFFTAPQATADSDVTIGLEFPGRRATLKLLQRFETALDEVFASPSATRPYALSSVSITYNSLVPAHLSIIASILGKVRDGTYNFACVELESFADRPSGSRKLQPGKARDGRMDVVTAAAVHLLPTTHPRDLSSSRLKSVTLDINEHIIAPLFSALRCGCTVESICLRVSLSALQNCTAAGRRQFWRWLAFGLFRSRPRRFKTYPKQTCRIEFSYVSFETEAVKAFADGLTDSARSLAFGDGADEHQDAEISGDQATLFYKLPAGARMYSRAIGSTKVLQTLERESELEMLVRDQDRACVVVPGAGLAWVETEQILSAKRELVDESADRDLELSFINFQAHPENLAAITSFFEVAGRSLSSLKLLWNIASVGDSNTMISTVVRCCPNLRHLDLSRNGLGNIAIDTLTDALESSGLSSTLHTLQLEHNYFQHAGSAALARYLSPDVSGTVPALRELRLVNIYADAGTFSAIRELLSVNKTLQYIALKGPFRSQGGGGLEMEERRRLQDQFHGETLPTARCDSLPLAQKLAFLSVVRGPNALGDLDSFMAARIFQFAATQTRRRIVWV